MSLRSPRSLVAALATLLILPVATLGIWTLSTANARAGGQGAFLGVHLTEETELDEGGARVTMVVPDSAADRSGIEVGDVIVEFDGASVHGPMGLSERIGERDAGDRVNLTVIRDGRERTLDAELGERTNALRLMGLPGGLEHLACDEDDTHCSFSFSCEGDDCAEVHWQMARTGGKPLLGVQLVEMTGELRRHMGSEADEGVLVSLVIEESAAEAGGVEVGDVIVAVDGHRIGDVDDLRRALSTLAGKRFDVDVVRDGRARTLGVTLPDAEALDHSMMRMPRALEDDVMKTVRQALDQARIDLGRVRFDQRDVMKQVHRALDEARRSQRKALRAADEAIGQSLEWDNSI